MIAVDGERAKETELAGIIQAYSEVTDRLKHSHELLRAEVCRLRELLEEKSRELQRSERLAALGEMAAGVAHEIRNPLGGIKLYASLLEKDLADRPKPLGLAQRITGGVCNLEGIVGDILAFAADSEPKCRPCELVELIGAVIVQASSRCDTLSASIEVDDGLRDVWLHCDGVQVRRALLNCVLNALDAAGSRGRVWIRRASQPGAAGLFAICVEDDGPGIPLELRQRVFNPFFTTKEAGTGLGLAIVHRIVESHGGMVRVSSRVGGGAAFRLCFPVHQEKHAI